MLLSDFPYFSFLKNTDEDVELDETPYHTLQEWQSEFGPTKIGRTVIDQPEKV